MIALQAMITAKEKRQIIQEHMRERMTKLGRVSSPAKRKAVLRNLQKANAARRRNHKQKAVS